MGVVASAQQCGGGDGDAMAGVVPADEDGTALVCAERGRPKQASRGPLPAGCSSFEVPVSPKGQKWCFSV